MTKYIITYTIDLDVPESIYPEMEAYYWHYKVLKNSDTELPEHVHVVNTVPDVKEVQ